MNLRKFLSREESQALDDAAQDAYDRAISTPERTDAFISILRDAEQSHQQWAQFAVQHCMESGAASLLKNRMKALNVVEYVSHDGRKLGKTASIGVKRKTEEGITYVTQELFFCMTKSELLEKRREYLIQIKAYDDNVGLIDKAVALIDSFPGAVTPQDAADGLGITVKEWMVGSRAA